MTPRLGLPDYWRLAVVRERDGLPHRMLAAAVRLGDVVARASDRLHARRNTLMRLEALEARMLRAEVRQAIAAGDLGPVSYGEPASARAQARRRRVESSGLRVIPGGAS